ncbi:MAG: C-terminal binding protein [Chloroflexota bacterium]
MSFRVFQVDPSPELEPYAVERATLESSGGSLVLGACETQDQIIERAGGAEVLWLAWKPTIDRRVLEALPSVRLAIRWGVGFEQIDTQAATELGVAVANAPTYGTDDVAETAAALLLATARSAGDLHAELRQGGWGGARLGNVHRLRGRTLGLLGAGRIGASLGRIAMGLGMHVIAYDVARPADELRAEGFEPVDLDGLTARADVISVHVPAMPSTHHLVDAAFLARCRPGVIIVNTARGRIVDTDALVEALHSGHVSAAGLDVFEQEPLPADAPIRRAPNVVLTPHIAGYSIEAFEDLRLEMCRTTIDFMTTGWATTIVNPAVRDRLRG